MRAMSTDRNNTGVIARTAGSYSENIPLAVLTKIGGPAVRKFLAGMARCVAWCCARGADVRGYDAGTSASLSRCQSALPNIWQIAVNRLK